MLKGNNVTLKVVGSAYAKEFTGILNRITWRENWEIERIVDVEKKLKDGKYHKENRPLVLATRNSDNAMLGYVVINMRGNAIYGYLEAYADPSVALDEDCWIEAIQLCRDFLIDECRKDGVHILSVKGFDPLAGLYEKLGFKLIGTYRSKRFVQGKLTDIDDLGFIRKIPYPITKVTVEDLSGVGGMPDAHSNYSG
ncbi:hypothetical protein J7K50_09050 [bacterium]|nr:hypothetical protein [bacterium]